MDETITPELVLKAYAAGFFPMSESRDDPEIFWVDPERRGIIPLDAFHVPTRLRRTVRSDKFIVTADRAFEAVIDACAEPGPHATRGGTWINGTIRALYVALHKMGHAHSIEAWRDGRLVGGLYGVSLGAALFGESMFSRERDASKVALVHLVARLKLGGYLLLDTQFITEHLAQFGTIEISKRAYRQRLAAALKTTGEFYSFETGLGAGVGVAGGVAGSSAGAAGGSAGSAEASQSRSGSSGGGGAAAVPPINGVVGVATVSGASVLQLTTQTS